MAVNVRVSVPHWARNGDPFRNGFKLMRDFRTACQDFGLASAMRENEYYTKPGELRRRKKRQAEARKRAAALRDMAAIGQGPQAGQGNPAKAKKKKNRKDKDDKGHGYNNQGR